MPKADSICSIYFTLLAANSPKDLSDYPAALSAHAPYLRQRQLPLSKRIVICLSADRTVAMVLPAQFQLGLELTNIVNPISQAVSALGSLAVIDAIKKSGSDFITETKLASLIGRHRIDPVIEFHFREMVTKSDQSVISRYLDIILESGSGPTVQEALKNPALFSMVIQLSGLAFAHEDESLANAIVYSIEKIVQESKGDVGIVPDYVSLLGTLRACQQQTATFRWALLYEAAEEKLVKAWASSRTNKGGYHGSRLDESRSLPLPVLQGLLMWLQPLQSFPEHRLLHLRCDAGISTIVVWCHHILGLSLIIKIYGTEICFGDAPYNIVLEESHNQQTGVSLMDPLDPHEPLFTLQKDQDSMGISHERRAEAYGYGIKLLRSEGIAEHEWKRCGQKVISHTVQVCEEFNARMKRSGIHLKYHANYPSRARLLTAGRFVFAFDEDLPILAKKTTNKLEEMPTREQTRKFDRLLAIIITFARVFEDDLTGLKQVPLTLDALDVLSYKGFDGPEYKYFSLLQSFEVLSLLLIGRHIYNTDYVKHAVLVSAWGWSVFLDSLDAVDPFDVSINTMRVRHGVPSRRGLRRSRIVDGPQTSPAITEAVMYDADVVHIAQGASTAEKGVSLVGYHSDAFQVTQEYTLNQDRTSKCRYGFRKMIESSIKSRRLPSCKCDKPQGETSASTSHDVASSERTISSIDKILIGNGGPRTHWSSQYYLERVFTTMKHHQRVFIYVSDNPAARWIELQVLEDISLRDADFMGYHREIVLRGQNTCVKCAVQFLPSEMILLL